MPPARALGAFGCQLLAALHLQQSSGFLFQVTTTPTSSLPPTRLAVLQTVILNSVPSLWRLPSWPNYTQTNLHSYGWALITWPL